MVCVWGVSNYRYIAVLFFLSLRLIPRKMVIRNASEEEVSDISFDDNDSLILKASSKHFKGYAIFLILILMHTITIYMHKHSSIVWDLLACQNIFCVLELIACVSLAAFLITICLSSLSVCPSVECLYFQLISISFWANLNQTWHKESLYMLSAFKVV